MIAGRLIDGSCLRFERGSTIVASIFLKRLVYGRICGDLMMVLEFSVMHSGSTFWRRRFR